MYKLFETVRKIQERVGDKIIRVEAVVSTSKKHNMTVTDYISRIRSIEGVTIVRAEETLEKHLTNTSKILLKIDGEYLPEGSVDSILEKVRSQALSIPGVLRFTYVKAPTIS